jgi:hypothetical protein
MTTLSRSRRCDGNALLFGNSVQDSARSERTDSALDQLSEGFFLDYFSGLNARAVLDKSDTDDELRRIIEVCDRMPEVTWSSGSGKGSWTGEDLKDFIWMMTYTDL